MIKQGEEIPHFALKNENGEVVSKDSLLGIKYVLFFYPKDDSPSCTKEACSLRDNYNAITRAGYKIFGVSPDNEKKHKKFIERYEFQYSLLADVDLSLIQGLGLWGPKKFMGKDIIGVYRTTLLIDENGMITHFIDDVKTAEHGQQIIQAIGLRAGAR
jgi:thioredoxin-dependent peroxiredoxin